METTMTLEKYKSMKKAKNVREEKKLKNIDMDCALTAANSAGERIDRLCAKMLEAVALPSESMSAI